LQIKRAALASKMDKYNCFSSQIQLKISYVQLYRRSLYYVPLGIV